MAEQLALPLLTYKSNTCLLREEVALILETKQDCLAHRPRSVNYYLRVHIRICKYMLPQNEKMLYFVNCRKKSTLAHIQFTDLKVPLIWNSHVFHKIQIVCTLTCFCLVTPSCLQVAVLLWEPRCKYPPKKKKYSLSLNP